MLAIPPFLQRRALAAIAEETGGSLRHDLRNKLAAVRNSAFYIKRKLEKATTLLAEDPRLAQFFGLIESELEAANALVQGRQAARPEAVACGVEEVTRALLAQVALPAGVEVEVSSTPLRVVVAPVELQLALFCLLENAVEAAAGVPGARVRIDVVDRGELVPISVFNTGGALTVTPEEALKPFFSTKPERLGLGLSVARRVALCAGGGLELSAEEGGVRATLLLRAARTEGGGQ